MKRRHLYSPAHSRVKKRAKRAKRIQSKDMIVIILFPRNPTYFFGLLFVKKSCGTICNNFRQQFVNVRKQVDLKYNFRFPLSLFCEVERFRFLSAAGEWFLGQISTEPNGKSSPKFMPISFGLPSLLVAFPFFMWKVCVPHLLVNTGKLAACFREFKVLECLHVERTGS